MTHAPDETTAGDARSPDDAPLPYRLLTGTDDRAFCAKVSEALDAGYELWGSPAVAIDGERTFTAQAVILPGGAS